VFGPLPLFLQQLPLGQFPGEETPELPQRPELGLEERQLGLDRGRDVGGLAEPLQVQPLGLDAEVVELAEQFRDHGHVLHPDGGVEHVVEGFIGDLDVFVFYDAIQAVDRL